MAKKKIQEKGFDSRQYFDSSDTFCPFKDIKLKPRTEEKKSVEKSTVSQKKAYEMYKPTSVNVVQKVEELPLSFLRECSPQMSLDLHGKRPSRDDIASLVREFLELGLEKGKKKVEIVVGKGSHSTTEPVLPSLVEVVLKQSPIVREYEAAPANKGGSGAYWVILGKKGAKPVNVYSTKGASGTDIKGLDKVKVAKSIDYEAYMPKVDDILDKMGK